MLGREEDYDSISFTLTPSIMSSINVCICICENSLQLNVVWIL